HMLEEGNADLEETYNACKRVGDITDDFSLVSLSYEPVTENHNERTGIRSKISQARAMVAQHDYANAIQLLENAYELSHDNHHVARALAHILYKAGRLKEAAHYFDSYTENTPGDTRALKLLGTILYELGEKSRAADILTRLRIRNPSDEKINAQLDKIYAELAPALKG
ncbi:MAG TPA: tetratricopeptide repeat protein, partial [Turneriella sp.]|nr:tetratricopeptide repeat protein [Turneriella sp.]